MAELRYNPLLDDWVMVSASRAGRPDMPKDFCPFCADSGKVPTDYDVLKYDNDFPILSQKPPQPDFEGTDFYPVAESYGKCDVILYSPNHYKQLKDLSLEHIEKLVRLWKNRFETLAEDKKICYILPFENRGKEVGTTMPHPHGQIYAYSKMPLRLRMELENAKKHYEKTGENLFQTMLREEQEAKERYIFENEDFAVVLPFFCEYPYGCYILSKQNLPSLAAFEDRHIKHFAQVLKDLAGTFDTLFDKPFPYMMGLYQVPVNSEATYPGVENYYRFHVKFFPPLRAEKAIKWCASSETCAWVHGNPRKVEETALELKQAYRKYQEIKEIPMVEQLKALQGKDLHAKLHRLFTARYGVEGRLFFSPSRINVIGEHIDYNGGMVLPAAIEIGTYAVAAPNGIDKVRLKSLNIDVEGKIALDDLEYQADRSWMNYVTGVLKYMREEGHQIGGMDILVYGNIPNGSGLSSSASLELLIGNVQNVLFNEQKATQIELALIGKKVENLHIGVNSGIMDQFAVGMGKKDHAILLNTSTLEYRYAKTDLEPYCFVVMNTNQRRELADSKYNERRGECERALAHLQQHGFEHLQFLCDMKEEATLLAALKEIRSGLAQEVGQEAAEAMAKRVEHVVRENWRVYQMMEEMDRENLVAMGELLNQSHYSLRDLYEVTGLALDSITAAARAQEACLGARMTGAGFGGCAIALVKRDGIDAFTEAVAKIYREETGNVAEFFVSGLGNGPQEIR